MQMVRKTDNAIIKME